MAITSTRCLSIAAGFTPSRTDIRTAQNSPSSTYPGLELVSLNRIPNVTGAHNVCVLDDDLVIGCHSEIGALANLKTGETLWDSGSPVYTRGLAASADHLFIGESQITVRENRGSCAGADLDR